MGWNLTKSHKFCLVDLGWWDDFGVIFDWNVTDAIVYTYVNDIIIKEVAGFQRLVIFQLLFNVKMMTIDQKLISVNGSRSS